MTKAAASDENQRAKVRWYLDHAQVDQSVLGCLISRSAIRKATPTIQVQEMKVVMVLDKSTPTFWVGRPKSVPDSNLINSNNSYNLHNIIISSSSFTIQVFILSINNRIGIPIKVMLGLEVAKKSMIYVGRGQSQINLFRLSLRKLLLRLSSGLLNRSPIRRPRDHPHPERRLLAWP